jgi:hypothetical protein
MIIGLVIRNDLSISTSSFLFIFNTLKPTFGRNFVLPKSHYYNPIR